MRKQSSQDIDQSAVLQDYEEELNRNNLTEEVIYHERNHRKLVFFGTILTIVLGIVFNMVFGESSADNAAETIGNRISQSTQAGDTIIDSETNFGIKAKNFSVAMDDSNGTARMLIWDFNKEDLDQVKILVNGKPVKEQLILTNDPAAISIPVPSIVTITGLKDNGGGISYAVKFPNNRLTYFNVVSIGGSNTYTVTEKP